MEQYHDQLFSFLDKLEPSAKPEFGKMSAQHMVEHLAGNYMIAIGKINTPIFTPEEDLPKLKLFLMSEKPFKRELRIPILPEEPLPVKFEDLNTAKEKLKKTWEAFNQINPSGYKKDHPIFGSLDYEEWKRLLAKHNHHHLIQFGLV